MIIESRTAASARCGRRSLGLLVAIAWVAACGGSVEAPSVAAPPPPPLTATVTIRTWPLDGGLLPPLSLRA